MKRPSIPLLFYLLLICSMYTSYAQATSLHTVIAEQNIEQIKIILETEPEQLNALDEKNRTPLHFAVIKKLIPVVTYLCQRGAQTNTVSSRGMAPLLDAVRTGCTQIALCLCTHGADVDSEDDHGCSAIHWAIRFKNQEMVELLLERGANPNSVIKNPASKYRHTPLHAAVSDKSSDIVLLLCEANANVNVADPDFLFTPLHIAAELGDAATAEILLDRGAEVDAPDVDGETALYKAIRSGNQEIVHLLCQRNASTTSGKKIRVRTGDTRHMSSKSQGKLNKHEDVQKDPRMFDTSSALFCALEEEHFGIAAYLLTCGCSATDLAPQFQDSLIQFLCTHSIHDLVAPFLVQAACNPSLSSRVVDIATHCPGACEYQDEQGNTALHHAARLGNLDAVTTLQQHGASLNIRNSAGRIPYDCAKQNGNVGVVAYLEQFNKLYYALESCQHDDPSVIQPLIDTAPEDLSGTINRRHETPLAVAVRKGFVKIATVLCERGSPVDATDVHGFTPLHEAVRQGDAELTRILCQFHAPTNAQDTAGRTALHWLASRYDHMEIASILFEHGADCSIQETKQGCTPLHYAAQNGFENLMVAFLFNPQSNADANALDAFGSTPMHYAAVGGSVQILNLLADNGASLCVENTQVTAGEEVAQETPFHWAFVKNDPVVVSWFLERLASPLTQENTREPSELFLYALEKSTRSILALLLHYCLRKQHYGLAHLILEKEPRTVVCRDSKGRNAQFWKAHVADGIDASLLSANEYVGNVETLEQLVGVSDVARKKLYTMARLYACDDATLHPRTLLISGRRGCGKRTFATTFANYVGLPILHPQSTNKLVSETEWRQLFREAGREQQRPDADYCFVSVGCIDHIARPSEQDDSPLKRVLEEKLALLNDLGVNQQGLMAGRILVATTCDEKALDPQILSSFTERIRLFPPDEDERKRLLIHHLTLSPYIDLSPDFLDNFSAASKDCSSRDITRIAQLARRRAGTPLVGEPDPLVEDHVIRACDEQFEVKYADNSERKKRHMNLLLNKTEEVSFENLTLCTRGLEKLARRARNIQRAETDDARIALHAGILLYGPPGTGKTSFAQAFAHAAGYNFESIDADVFTDKYKGEGARKIREFFAQAKRAHPCVVFIDEIDSITIQDNEISANSQAIINALKTNIIDFHDGGYGIVIVATNYLDRLEKTFVNRFAFKEEMPLPKSVRIRKQILARKIESFRQKHRLQLTDDINDEGIDILAKRCMYTNKQPFSGRDITYLVHRAVMEILPNNEPLSLTALLSECEAMI